MYGAEYERELSKMQSHVTLGRVKVPAHHAGQGSARLIVRSIGTAGVALARSLRHVLPFSDADIAALLFQAPSEILSGLDQPRAEAMAGLLRETGLDCAVLDTGESVNEGRGDYEVALAVRDVERMPALLVEVVRLLGVDAATARSIVCRAPALLLGGISEATVNALRARFDALGADIDASRPAEARFDAFLGECPATVRERALERLRAAIGTFELSTPAASGASGSAGSGPTGSRPTLGSSSGPVAVFGLDHATADRVWRELRQSNVPVHVVNRDFARYDVVLQAAPDTDGVRRHLTTRAGIPAGVVSRVLANLPVVVHRALPHADLEAVLAELTQAGARAVAEPLAFQRFAVSLGEVRDARALVPVIGLITGMDEAAASSALRGRPARIAGPFLSVQARWLQHELRRAGADARLEAL